MEVSIIRICDKNGSKWFFRKKDYESLEFENFDDGEDILENAYDTGIFTEEEFDFLYEVIYDDIQLPNKEEVDGSDTHYHTKFLFLLCYN